MISIFEMKICPHFCVLRHSIPVTLSKIVHRHVMKQDTEVTFEKQE